MQSVKCQAAGGPTVNLLARTWNHLASDSLSIQAYQNIEVGKVVLRRAPESESSGFSKAILESLHRRLVVWGLIETTSSNLGVSAGISCIHPRLSDLGEGLGFKAAAISSRILPRNFVKSGALTNNTSEKCIYQADFRGPRKHSVVDFRGTACRNVHTETKGEKPVHENSEQLATVGRVRSTVTTTSSTNRRRRTFRSAESILISGRRSPKLESPNPLSTTKQEGETLSPNLHDLETHKFSGVREPITPSISPLQTSAHLQYVKDNEHEEISRRASVQARALLRAALEEADEEEGGKVEEEFQRSLRVGIVGAPNAGKSLLTNQLVGTRVSAVSRKTNTTHREHLGVYTEGETQLLYYDTPGLHLDVEGSPLRVDALHRVQNAWEIVDFCEALVVLVDAERQIRRPDKRVQRLVEKLGKEEMVSQKRILCFNKVDTVNPKKLLLPLAKQYEDFLGYDRIFMISGLTGSGLKDVKDYLVNQAVLRPWVEDPELKDHRDVALEVVREQVFEHLHEELPHTTKQTLVSWKVLKDGSIRIQQLLSVSKKEHQKILVGKNGAIIGDIGIKARKELTQILGATVHLVLDVKLATGTLG